MFTFSDRFNYAYNFLSRIGARGGKGGLLEFNFRTVQFNNTGKHITFSAARLNGVARKYALTDLYMKLSKGTARFSSRNHGCAVNQRPDIVCLSLNILS